MNPKNDGIKIGAPFPPACIRMYVLACIQGVLVTTGGGGGGATQGARAG